MLLRRLLTTIKKRRIKKMMSRPVKLRVILLFITAALSVCTAIGTLITMIVLACETIGVLPVKVCMIANVVLVALVLIQAYPLLKLPTTN